MNAAASRCSPDLSNQKPFADFAILCANIARLGTGMPTIGAALPITLSSEAVGSDGGYLVPPDFQVDVVQTLLSEESLLSHALRFTTTSNEVVFPVDAAPPWTASGVTAQWDGEGPVNPPGDHPVKPVLNGETLKLFKQTVFVPMSSELFEDAPGRGGYLSSVVNDRMLFKMNQALLAGDGVGKPLGILNSNALVVQAAEGGQTAGTVQAANVTKMWSRLYGPSKRRAVWIANSDVEPQLQALGFPTYVPAGMFGNASPLLNGRPVIYTEASPALGTQGDLVLADMGSYCVGLKVRKRTEIKGPAEVSIREDLSLHVYFDTGMAALRFTLRAAGRPLWNAPIQRKGGGTVSTFVALAAR